MENDVPRSTGLDARFDSELEAEIPGWRSEFEIASRGRARNTPSVERETPAERSVPAGGLEARFEAELAAAVPGWVRHDPAANRFELETGGRMSVAEYRRDGNRMILTRTHVPVELRGRGLAGRLVAAALEFARAEKLRVVPECRYVDAFLRRNPQFDDLRDK